MFEIDIERARELLKVVAVVAETHSNEVRVLFLDRQKYMRAKLLLSGAKLIEERSDEEAFHQKSGLYQLNILPDKRLDFLELLPEPDIDYGQRLLIEQGNKEALAEAASAPIPQAGRPYILTIPALTDDTRDSIAAVLSALQELYRATNPDDKRKLF